MAAAAVAPLDGFPAVEAPAQLAPASVAVEPVHIEIVRRCDWKQKPCGLCGKPKSNRVHRAPDKGGTCEFAAKLRCANCDRAKSHRDHFGQPPSWNVYGSGSREAWQANKKAWANLLVELLEDSGLGKGLLSVSVEGEVTFPRRASDDGPDQGNYRAPLEKILGDVLEAEGYLRSDNWQRYTFGGLEYRYEPGVSRTRLMIFARAPQTGEPAS